MKKSITVKSKTNWTKIKDFFGDFRQLKSILEKNRAESEELQEWFDKYIKNISDHQVDLNDFDIPVSELSSGKFKDIALKDTIIKAESNGTNDFKWTCNNLGSLKFTYNPDEDNIKVTIDFKPKFGFAISTFLKGLFMACPLEELESGIQELVDDLDDQLENGVFD